MKYPIQFLKGLAVLAIVLATTLFVERARIVNVLRKAAAPELPAAVSYEEVVGRDTDVEVVEGAEVAVGDVEDVEEIPSTASTNSAKPNDSTVPSAPPKPPATTTPAPALPASINLSVPFTSQAPSGNWDEVHEETCEEAAAYMVAAFYEGASGQISVATAEAELQRLVAREMELFGYYKDTNAAETARLIADVYGLRATLMENPTVEDIKASVAAGHPVIVPTAGRMLGNPNFTGDGPPYHMIVIRGYADGNFITNDPGTRRGDQYVYSEETIMNAIHDWTGSFETIETGSKVVVVVEPKLMKNE